MIAGMIAGAMSRMSRKRRALGRALVQDQHSAAVGRWVDTMILGLRLCPFAQPAAQRNGLKVVSSTGVTGDEVLEDLVTEGELLQADGEIATTLVVCPHVPEWQDFGSFHEFYAGELLNGRLLSRQLDLDVSIVAFHPSCSSSEVSVGLEVALQWQGQQWLAEVLEEDVSKELLSLRLLGQILETASSEDGGEDLAIQPLTEPQEVLCRRSDILWSLESLEGGGASVTSVRSALARAPRPVLHLLRSGELAKVDAEQREEIYKHNDQLLDRLGLDHFEILL